MKTQLIKLAAKKKHKKTKNHKSGSQQYTGWTDQGKKLVSFIDLQYIGIVKDPLKEGVH